MFGHVSGSDSISRSPGTEEARGAACSPPAPLPTLDRYPLLKCVAGERVCIFTSSLFEGKVHAPYAYSVGDNLVVHNID